MSLYSIVNPSDPYTIEATSLDVAATAILLLGQGKYGLQKAGTSEGVVPMFAFGGGDDWCRKHFKETLMEMSNRVMDTKLAQVAECLDSVLYGDEDDRTDFLADTHGMNRETFELARAIRQEEKRSSMDDIGMKAYRMSAKLTKAIEEGMRTLQ